MQRRKRMQRNTNPARGLTTGRTFLGMPATLKSTTTITPRLTIPVVLVHLGVVPPLVRERPVRFRVQLSRVSFAQERLQLGVRPSAEHDKLLVGLRVE